MTSRITDQCWGACVAVGEKLRRRGRQFGIQGTLCGVRTDGRPAGAAGAQVDLSAASTQQLVLAAQQLVAVSAMHFCAQGVHSLPQSCQRGRPLEEHRRNR